MSDLSKLTDQELEALAAGDMSKLSDASLAILVGGDASPAPAAKPMDEYPVRTNPRTGLPERNAVGNPETFRDKTTGVARYGIPLAGFMGGPAGAAASGGGEKLAQMIEGEDRPGDVAQAMAMGAAPLGGARGVTAGIKEALGVATAGAVGTQARSLLNDQKPASAGETGAAAVLPAILSMLGRGAGRGLGAATGNVAPEEMARVQAARLNNRNKDAVLATMQAQGARVVPSSVNPSMKNKVLESVAGIQNVEAGVARENQPIFNAIGRREASIPADAPINEATLEAARNAIGKESYAAARGSGAGQYLDNWRDAATKLKKAQADLDRGFTNARGAAVDQAQADMDAAAKALADATDGTPIAAEIQKAKQAFGKNYDVEKAVASGTDEVRPSVLSGLLEQRGEDGLSGGLRDIAQFNNAYGRSAKNPTKLATAPGAASAGTAMVAGGGNPVTSAALVGGIPVVREAIRDLLTSRGYQAKNAVRNYTPSTSADPRLTAIIQRLMLQAEMDKNRQ